MSFATLAISARCVTPKASSPIKKRAVREASYSRARSPSISCLLVRTLCSSDRRGCYWEKKPHVQSWPLRGAEADD